MNLKVEKKFNKILSIKIQKKLDNKLFWQNKIFSFDKSNGAKDNNKEAKQQF